MGPATFTVLNLTEGVIYVKSGDEQLPDWDDSLKPSQKKKYCKENMSAIKPMRGYRSPGTLKFKKTVHCIRASDFKIMTFDC